MAREIAGRIIEPGLVFMHSERAVYANSAVPVGRYDSVIDQRSYPRYLKQNLFNPEHTDTIFYQERPSGSVNTLFQLEPWERGAVMISAIADTVELEQLRVPVQFVYNYPKPLQDEYHKHLLSALHTSSVIKLPGENEPASGKPTVIAMENAVSQLSGDRLSGRSIATQHAVVVKTGFPVDEDPRAVIFAEQLLLSQKTLQKMPAEKASKALGEIGDKIQHAVHEDGVNLEFFERRADPPYGYTIITPIAPIVEYNVNDRNQLDNDAALLSDIMSANFFANAEVTERSIDEVQNEKFHVLFENHGLKGYANRHYYYFAPHPDTGTVTLHISISPTIFGGAAYENAGRMLIRRPDFPLPFTEEEVSNYRTAYTKETQNILGDNLSIVNC